MLHIPQGGTGFQQNMSLVKKTQKVDAIPTGFPSKHEAKRMLRPRWIVCFSMFFHLPICFAFSTSHNLQFGEVFLQFWSLVWGWSRWRSWNKTKAVGEKRSGSTDLLILKDSQSTSQKGLHWSEWSLFVVDHLQKMLNHFVNHENGIKWLKLGLASQFGDHAIT